jgi:hypothetical protein
MSAMSLGPPSDAAPPPPAATLLAAVEGMKAVRTRVPWRTVAALGLVVAAIPAGGVLFLGPRKDLAALPVAWVAATAVVWGAGVLVTLLAATWPRRGEVLPDTGKARLTAIIVAGLLLLLGIFGTADPTAETVVPESTLAGFGHWWWHCTKFALKAVIPVLVLGGLLLRRLFPVGGMWAGAALGAAGGAAAGLALHFVCAVGGGLHVAVAHGGGVVIGALLGMLLLPRVLRS